VQALVFIGDAMEELLDELAAMAGKLGRLRVPIFLFQEGRDSAVRKAFRLLALKSGGAYFRVQSERTAGHRAALGPAQRNRAPLC
jgi:hypothetical protein